MPDVCPNGAQAAPPRDDVGPIRICVGCRAKKPKAELLRLARDPGQGRPKVVFDPKGRLGGRGAWVCADSPACLAKATAKGKLAWALRGANPDLVDLIRPDGRQFHRNGCQRDG